MNYYRQNLETLRANADVLRPLVDAIDRVLEEPTFTFGGNFHAGPWFQSGGPENENLHDRSLQVARDFEAEVRAAQTRHLLATGEFIGATMYTGASYAVALRDPCQASGNVALLRRVHLLGLTPDSSSTEREYRAEIPEDGVIRILSLTFLSGVAVSAREYIRDAATMDLAQRGFSEFFDANAVEALMLGDFTDEAGLQYLLSRLHATPEQNDLVSELKAHAERMLAGRELDAETDLTFADRDKLIAWRGDIKRVFG